MIITKLEIENFGVFRGVNEFDLKPHKGSNVDKSIILFGGKNGAGKTTLFESVKLCLYGQWINGRKMRKQDYKAYIFKGIHQPLNSPKKSQHASITLNFEYGQLGEIQDFKVVRSWVRKGNDYKEKLEIYKNGKPLKDVDPDQWQDFINDLIPQGVSQLFFFDGEKIQNLAEEQESNFLLQESFKSLLNLHLPEKLQSDLTILAKKKLKFQATSELKKQIKEQQYEIREINEHLDRLNQKRAKVNSKLSNVVGNLEHLEQKIASEGGGYAAKRENYKERLNEAELKINEIEEKIRELSGSLLPFAITPKYCDKLKERIEKEEKIYNYQISKKVIEEKLDEIENKLEDENTKEIIKESFSPIINSHQETQIIHQISPSERFKLLDAIDKVKTETPEKAKNLFKELEKNIKIRQDVQIKLKKIPSDDVLKPLMEKYNKLGQEKGKLEERIKYLDSVINREIYRKNEHERKLNVLLERVKSDQNISQQLTLSERVQDVLKKYEKELKKYKVKGLQDRFIESFRKINRKTNFVRHVNIEPNSFQVDLYTNSSSELAKDQLSAGEKQLFAISMLWALIKMSNRKLPLIIDTPLGRLDSEHREKIVNNFFPQASQQTILLSTDTEIDKHYFDMLQPYIAHSYHFEYYSDEGYTHVEEGYFWKHKEPKEVVH